MKKTILSLLSMAFICAMTLTSCDEIMSTMDNPVDSYLKVDAEVFVKEGSAVELYAETISDAEVTYTVGDEKIAKVEKVSNHEVKVIGVKPGETVINVKLAANAYYKAGEAKVKVVVTPAVTLADAVKDGAKLKIGYKFNGEDYIFSYEFDADKKAFNALDENNVPEAVTNLYNVTITYDGEGQITQKLVSKKNEALVPFVLNLYTAGSFDRIYKLPIELKSVVVNNYNVLPYTEESVTPIADLQAAGLSDNMTVGEKGSFAVTGVTPQNATNQVIKYSSSNTAVMTIDAYGNFEAVGAGEATLKAEATDGSGKFVEKEITVTAEVNLSELTAEYTAPNGVVLKGETNYKISIAKNATVSLSGATINNSVECLGTATIVLVKETVNTITTGKVSTALIAGPAETTLTIKGEGQLNANAGSDHAGIGSPYKGTCGNIVIEGGIINASTAYGAAIGAADGGGVCGDITISGGTVTATKNDGYGAAIGSGDSYGGGSACGNITITGGNVTAIGGPSGPGIGAGGLEANYNSTCKNITITGGTVTATGGAYAAGIGTGYGTYSSAKSSCGNITISGGTVVATKGDNATWDVGPSNTGQVGTVSVSVTVKDVNGNNASIYSGAASAPRRANAKPVVLPVPTPRR